MPMPTPSIRGRAEAISSFWFSTLDDDAVLAPGTEPFASCFARWYGKRPEIDREIRRLFEEDLLAVTRDGSSWNAQLDAWSAVPDGLLALVVLLDQFPRNMYRDTPRMYQYDPLALTAAFLASRAGVQRSLPLVKRMFLVVPLMHIESVTIQEAMVREFEELVELARSRSPRNASFFAHALSYARRHLEIVRSFDRFPHRNQILGRDSTDAELRFLQQPDSAF
jgi:uncharacterized protein (DUF924 family)